MRSECARFPRPGWRDQSLSDGCLDPARPRPLPRPGLRVAAACGSGTVACGEELQGALSASGRAGTWRSRQGALRKPESGGLRAPPPPALPPGGAGCRWRAQHTATEAGTGGGECGREASRRAGLCRGSRGATPERCPRCWDREAGAGFQAAGVSPATKLFPLSTRSPVSTSPYALLALGAEGGGPRPPIRVSFLSPAP